MTTEALHSDHPGHEAHPLYEPDIHLEQHSSHDHHTTQNTIPYSPETVSATHNIGLKEGSVCSADCPDHGHKQHIHDDQRTLPSHESTSRGHSIEHKETEHRCAADCPEHNHGSHTAHTAHTHRSSEHSHKHTHTIEHKPHACGSDCPEHSSPHAHSHSAHEHTEHGHHAHTVERKVHACGADWPEHGATDAAGHHTHQHETPGHSEHAAKYDEQDSVRLPAPAEDIAYQAIMELTQRTDHAEALATTTTVYASTNQPKATASAPASQQKQSRENMVEPVKTFDIEQPPKHVPEPYLNLEHVTTPKFIPSHDETADEHFETALSAPEQVKLPQESAALEPLQAETPASTVPLQHEFPSELDELERAGESLPYTVSEPVPTGQIPAELPLTTAGSEPVPMSPEAPPLAADQEIVETQTASAAFVTSTTEKTVPPELPPLPSARYTGDIQTKAEAPSLLTLSEQIPSESAAELAAAVAGTLTATLETASQQPTHNSEQQIALRRSLARLRELQKNPAEQQDIARLHQEIVRLLGLLGYRDPVQTLGLYLQRYGEQFSQSLLMHLVELLVQSRIFEHTPSTPLVQHSLPTARPSLGALVLRLYQLGYLFRPALASIGAA
ncbi:hypothetical protein EYC59_02890 [Candidatus Saccharibacteria bacterium]|nr:MAG: hypothetical protein EYC59_02890 [Candidatus Saccharibacteria bacterium]